MVNEADSIDYIKTDSVLEALILEAHLIKKYQPEANVLEKDNRSFNFVVITDEDFPRVLIKRGRELLYGGPTSVKTSLPMSNIRKEEKKSASAMRFQAKHIFGPFPNGGQLKEALKLIRRLFPYRDKCTPCQVKDGPLLTPKFGLGVSGVEKSRCKPCFNRQIGLCPGVCSGEMTREQYSKQIENIVLFFEGKKKELTKNLKKQMKTFSLSQEYENANKVKKTLFAMNHIRDVSLIKDDYRKNSGLDAKDTFRIESYDIAHMAGENVVGVMTVVEDGEVNKSEYRKFRIRQDPGVNDTKALKEILERRLGHIEWKQPNLIVVDGGMAQKRAIEETLKRNNQKIPVVSVVKDERHKPNEILGERKWLKYEKEILLSNAEAHRFAILFHRKSRWKVK
jgi:excinuclease UvrABC nuclease subunit